MVKVQKNKAAVPPVSDPMIPRQFRISRLRRETKETFSTELMPVSGCRDFPFEPGQFNMLYIFGVGEIPISISGDPTHHEVLIHTTRAVGNVTKAMNRMTVGDTIGIRGPLGTGWPVKEAEGNDVVLVSGGIGLAPLRPLIYQMIAHRDKFGKIVLLCGSRTPDDLIYRRELEKWRSRHDMEVHVTVDRATASWRGNVGVVTTLIGKTPFDYLKCTAMVCGPEVMMRFTVLELQKRGVNGKNIHVSMERNMKCGIGLCGHCQIGANIVCKNGPVFCYEDIKDTFNKREF
ncbi:MAG: FAD/NAD(P)-binding protein [Desulfobacterales bacterium]